MATEKPLPVRLHQIASFQGELLKEEIQKDMVNDNQIDNMLTIREAAQLLHVHPNTLRRCSDEGRIAAYRIASRGDRRFTRPDIAVFLSEFNAYRGDEKRALTSEA